MYRSDVFPFIYRFPLLDKFDDALIAGITGREGDFNTALHTGDDRQKVIENRKRLCSAIGLDFDSYTCAEQTHGSHVHRVTDPDKGRGRMNYEDSIKDTDALVTKESGILLNIHLADCVPVILYDFKKQVGALAHGGWKGTANLISIKTVEKMIKEFNCRSENIIAAIGPSIGPCCFEIGSDTAEKINSTFSYSRGTVFKKDRSYFGDLKKANREQLLSCGLNEANIEISQVCTSCSNEDFFSYRADGGVTGRFSAYLSLK